MYIYVIRLHVNVILILIVYRLNETLSKQSYGNNESIFRNSISHLSATAKNICNEIHGDEGQTSGQALQKDGSQFAGKMQQ